VEVLEGESLRYRAEFLFRIPIRELVHVRREIRSPAQQCLDAFEDMVGVALGTNSLESRFSGFVA